MLCPVCGVNELEGKQKVCSGACRVKQSRQKEVPEQEVAPAGTPTGVTLTETDALFEARNPGYYKFEDEVRDVACRLCGVKFKTTLSLLKFCSPDCAEGIMVVIAGKGK